MTQTIKKMLALLLVLVQLFVLFPVLQPQAKAVDTETEDELPALNPVIEGTVRFGSFNYTGDNGGTKNDTSDDRDGLDYVSTFYYSDDYFSRSAVNPNATAKTMDWDDLEDLSMATLSKDFTIAAYGSSENTFPTVWDHKDKNAIKFLNDCGFENAKANDEFNIQTGADTIGAVFGSKEITVWNADTQKNETYTLVAIGVRGAGYGAEWASNVTLADPDNPPTLAQCGNDRHYGFDHSADKVLEDLDTFLKKNPITTEKAKYWVVGYSRAGAVANLVAGALSDDDYSKYKTDNEHVYGYTYEAAAGALKTEDPNGTVYRNIHNIINPMDAVPLVSPILFNHSRLGVDYKLPYYGNVGKNDTNRTYYSRMYETLKNVAVIADLYKKGAGGNNSDNTQDPTLTDADPNSYPYNSTLQVSSFGITNLVSGGDFTESVSNSDASICGSSGIMMDTFLSNMVNAAFNSRAWDAKDLYYERKWTSPLHITYDDIYYSNNMQRNAPMHHLWRFVTPAAGAIDASPNDSYQSAIRTLAYLALKNPGVGLSAVNSMMDKFGASDILSNGINIVSLGTQYFQMSNAKFDKNNLNNNTNYNEQVYELQDEMQTILTNLIGSTGLFDDDLNAAKNAIKVLTPPLTWLYCEDYKWNNAEYLGTLFDYVSTILVTHIPELGVSWLMSLDDVFISDYREIALPSATAVKLYEFRPGIDDAFSKDSHADKLAAAEATGAEIGMVLNGDLAPGCKDARVTATKSADGQTVTIRYPGNLDIRLDVAPLSGETVNGTAVTLSDWAPANVVNIKSDCTRAGANDSEGLNEGNIKTVSIDHAMTTNDDTQSATDNNALLNGDLTLTDKDTLRVMAWHGSNQVADSYEAEYALLKNSEKAYVIDFGGQMLVAEDAELVQTRDGSSHFSQSGDDVVYQINGGTSLTSSANLIMSGVESAHVLGNPDLSKSTQLYWSADISAIPASCVYFDDSLNGKTLTVGDGSGLNTEIDNNGAASVATAIDSSAEAKTLSYTFKGTGIDVYCTTDSQSGYIQATLKDSAGAQVGNSKLVRNYSETERYNVPTVSFHVADSDYGQYTLELKVLKGANYKLDGVRIYNPLGTAEQAETQQVYKDTTEGNAQYVNLRDNLVNDSSDYSVSVEGSGVLFVDDAEHLMTQKIGDDGELVDIYTSDFAAYKANGPKHEIYLKPGQAITFEIDKEAGSHYWVGLSAPAKDHTSGKVAVNKNTFTVNSATDMYYEITDYIPAATGNVTIQNASTDNDAIISVTNFKATSPVQEMRLFGAFKAVSARTVMTAVENSYVDETQEIEVPEVTPPVETAAPEETTAPTEDPVVTPSPTPTPAPETTPTPTNPSSDSSVMQLISSFVKSLFGGFSRLFRPLVIRSVSPALRRGGIQKERFYG